MSMACFAMSLDRYGLGRLDGSGCICICASLGLSLPEPPRLLIIPRQHYNAIGSRGPNMGLLDVWGGTWWVATKDSQMRLTIVIFSCYYTGVFGNTKNNGTGIRMSKLKRL